MATERTLRLRLSAYERGLIWDYGYPFEDLRRQLQALAENDDGEFPASELDKASVIG